MVIWKNKHGKCLFLVLLNFNDKLNKAALIKIVATAIIVVIIPPVVIAVEVGKG